MLFEILEFEYGTIRSAATIGLLPVVSWALSKESTNKKVPGIS